MNCQCQTLFCATELLPLIFKLKLLVHNANELRNTAPCNCNCHVFQKQLQRLLIACFQMIIQTSLVQERFSASNVAASQPLTSMASSCCEPSMIVDN